MNFWLALIISVVFGLYIGKQLKPKGKKFSWLAFFITLFLLLGGIDLIFGIAFGVLHLIQALFFLAAFVLACWMGYKLLKKRKEQRGQPAPATEEELKDQPVEETPKEEPSQTSPHEPPKT
jgi:membrane protein implicated in regulation of membrane protease activity